VHPKSQGASSGVVPLHMFWELAAFELTTAALNLHNTV
jgi:hypothetical protein